MLSTLVTFLPLPLFVALWVLSLLVVASAISLAVVEPKQTWKTVLRTKYVLSRSITRLGSVSVPSRKSLLASSSMVRKLSVAVVHGRVSSGAPSGPRKSTLLADRDQAQKTSQQLVKSSTSPTSLVSETRPQLILPKANQPTSSSRKTTSSMSQISIAVHPYGRLPRSHTS